MNKLTDQQEDLLLKFVDKDEELPELNKVACELFKKGDFEAFKDLLVEMNIYCLEQGLMLNNNLILSTE